MKLGIPSRKYVYVFSITPQRLFTLQRLRNPLQFWRLLWCLYLGKVGFESEGTDRAGGVEYSIRERLNLDVKVKRVIRVKVFMYRPIEKAVHNVLRGLGMHSPHLKGCSGWTEIFRIFNVISGLACMLFAYAYLPPYTIFGIGLPVIIALIVMVAPRPLDMALFVLFLYGVEICCYVFLWWAAYQASAVFFGILNI